MSGKQAMTVILILALLSVVGLIGMLVVDGIADIGFFVLTVAPLLLGAAAWTRHRRP